MNYVADNQLFISPPPQKFKPQRAQRVADLHSQARGISTAECAKERRELASSYEESAFFQRYPLGKKISDFEPQHIFN